MTIIKTSTDHELKGLVEQELSWSSNVDDDRVGVTVTSGAVMLSGEVLSYPEKAAAVSAALRVGGVTALADEIIVRHAFGHIKDADIAEEAASALRQTTAVPAGTVQAVVRNHAVVLTGAVAWHYQRTAAVDAVSALRGVVAVKNLIELEPRAVMVASTEAKANITAALLRSAQLEAQNIEVTVSGTEIRLTGQVESWVARHEAEYAAWCTPGVTHVVDKLVVQP